MSDNILVLPFHFVLLCYVSFKDLHINAIPFSKLLIFFFFGIEGFVLDSRGLLLLLVLQLGLVESSAPVAKQFEAAYPLYRFAQVVHQYHLSYHKAHLYKSEWHRE